MGKLDNHIPAAKLKKLTLLHPQKYNVPQQSVTFSQITRYVKIRAFLHQFDFDDLIPYLQPPVESVDVNDLLKSLGDLESDTNHYSSMTVPSRMPEHYWVKGWKLTLPRCIALELRLVLQRIEISKTQLSSFRKLNLSNSPKMRHSKLKILGFGTKRSQYWKQELIYFQLSDMHEVIG